MKKKVAVVSVAPADEAARVAELSDACGVDSSTVTDAELQEHPVCRSNASTPRRKRADACFRQGEPRDWRSSWT